MSEVIQEFVDSRQQRLRVDRAAGVIRGVKLLGLTSRNGRRYREDALVEAVGLYEGAKVNINHPKGHPLAPRDYQDRLGVVRGIAYRPGEGLFGDLHFNPNHALSEQLMWDAEHAPQNVGMSHNVLARTKRNGEETVVEAITKVQSIDLVADPATTAGLYEQVEGRESTVEGRGPERLETRSMGDSNRVTFDSLTLEELRLHRPDLVTEIAGHFATELQQAQTRLDEIVAQQEATRRRDRIIELLREHDLPVPAADDTKESQLVSEQFIESLMQAPDEGALQRLVEERAAILHSAWRWKNSQGPSNRPRSRDQLEVATAGRHSETSAEFAASIRGG
jgi:hypothetical protein